MVALYEAARGIARELGFELPEVAMGGASDGNFTAALGIPTLDGLGLVGEGAPIRWTSSYWSSITSAGFACWKSF